MMCANIVQLAQDDDGFEIRSFTSALDEENAFAGPDEPGSESRRELSPMPPKPEPGSRLRESIDTETIFAVGEDGERWTDDEDESPRSSSERKRLTEEEQK